MNLIDTHAHLYLKQFDEDRKEMMLRANENGINRFFLPNIDVATIDSMLQLEQEYPNCHAMMGLHPCSAKENYKEELAIMRKWLDKRAFCAIGEIGLDYYWSTDHVEQQKAALRTQIAWAKEMNLPIILHARDSMDDLIQIIEEEQDGNLRGIFHCFGGSVEQAQRIIDTNFLMGIGGVLTFKKSGLDKVITEINLKHLVLETDAPFLAPTPFRGKRNESSYILNIAQKLAEVKEIELEEVARVTTANALGLFKL